MRMRTVQMLMLFALISEATEPCLAQTSPALQTYFKEYIGLTDEQIRTIRRGQAVAKALQSRIPDEVFVFGAVYIKAEPEAYLQFSRDFDRLRTVPGYLAIGKLSNPPQLSELKGFAFDSEDVKDLKKCKPGSCQVQLPASRIEDFQKSVDWSGPNAEEQAAQLLQKAAVERIAAYHCEGNTVLGAYNDKRNPTNVAEQFKYMLSYSKALPKYLPDFYNYLLSYPNGKREHIEDAFYWDKVKFGLKPTLRVVHVLTLHGTPPGEPDYTIAEKQLYSSHYFQTALELAFCVRDSSDSSRKGFYLIQVLGSEQAGLTGFKGSIVRKVAVDRSASSLQKSLSAIKNVLQHNP